MDVQVTAGQDDAAAAGVDCEAALLLRPFLGPRRRFRVARDRHVTVLGRVNLRLERPRGGRRVQRQNLQLSSAIPSLFNSIPCSLYSFLDPLKLAPVHEDSPRASPPQKNSGIHHWI